jgi:3-oxoadipate enol-lactonase
MKHLINGLSVFIEGNNKNKAIVFLHGFPYDHSMWQKQCDSFYENYFCVTYDIRGLGTSPAGNGQFTMESFVDDLEIIIDELKLHKPILCGLSMGGYIALRAMERIQEKFSALILCDTRSEADNNDGKLKRGAGIKRITVEGIAPFTKDFITNCFGEDFKNNKGNDLKKIIERSSEYDPVGVKGSLLAMISRTDTTPVLSKINIPTLIICGEQDALTPPSVMKEMFHKINNADFVEINKAGHMTPIESPEEVNKTIQRFLFKI